MEAVRVYVEGVHCANCLKKIDSLKAIVKGLHRLDFDMSTKTLSAELAAGSSDLELQRAIETLGFSARILDPKEGTTALEIAADRDLLFRLCLAGLAAGNIMLLAISTYAGAIGFEARFMGLLSLILATPSVLYAAWPIHKAALSDLSRFRISVELPISAAIVAGYALSLWSLAVGAKHVYFDSISVLIFLVLAGRFLLSRIQRRFLGLTRFQSLFRLASVARRNSSGVVEDLDVRGITATDRLLIKPGEVIPVDATLQSEFATLDTSLLTGESRPHELRSGEAVFLGQKNLGDEIEIQALNSFSESRLFKILNEVEKAVTEKPRAILLLDKVGQFFLTSVFLLALGCLVYFWPSDPNEGVRRALAVILVSCPCTFAFGAPMVFSLALNRMAGLGVLIKHPNVFEKLLQIKQVVLDKTGTLTDGLYDLLSFQNVSASEKDLIAIRSICERSKHPVSRGLSRYLSGLEIPAHENLDFEVVEVPTVGLQAKLLDQTYLVNRFGVTKNGKSIVQLEMGDQVWPEAAEMVSSLKSKGLPVFLLSGDSKDRVDEIASLLQIDSRFAFASQSPEMKSKFLSDSPHSLMVGDGANDSLAMAKASVGIAVHGSLGTALEASDVFLFKKDLRLVPVLFAVSKMVNRVLHRNLGIAVVYNLFAATLAVAGYIHPLIAAILMPLSSFSQLISGLGVLRGSKWT